MSPAAGDSGARVDASLALVTVFMFRGAMRRAAARTSVGGPQRQSACLEALVPLAWAQAPVCLALDQLRHRLRAGSALCQDSVLRRA